MRHCLSTTLPMYLITVIIRPSSHICQVLFAKTANSADDICALGGCSPRRRQVSCNPCVTSSSQCTLGTRDLLRGECGKLTSTITYRSLLKQCRTLSHSAASLSAKCIAAPAVCHSQIAEPAAVITRALLRESTHREQITSATIPLT